MVYFIHDFLWFLDKGRKIIIQKNPAYDRVLHRWFARA